MPHLRLGLLLHALLSHQLPVFNIPVAFLAQCARHMHLQE